MPTDEFHFIETAYRSRTHKSIQLVSPHINRNHPSSKEQTKKHQSRERRQLCPKNSQPKVSHPASQSHEEVLFSFSGKQKTTKIYPITLKPVGWFNKKKKKFYCCFLFCVYDYDNISPEPSRMYLFDCCILHITITYKNMK